MFRGGTSRGVTGGGNRVKAMGMTIYIQCSGGKPINMVIVTFKQQDT